MITGLRGSYHWNAASDVVPEAYAAVLLSRLLSPEDEKGSVEPGYWDGLAWFSSIAGSVRDVTHWTPFPPAPVAEQMRRVLDELSSRASVREGAEYGA